MKWWVEFSVRASVNFGVERELRSQAHSAADNCRFQTSLFAVPLAQEMWIDENASLVAAEFKHRANEITAKGDAEVDVISCIRPR